MAALARGERLQIMLTDDELAALDDWRFDKRMPSRASAVRELLKRGLAAEAAGRNVGQRAPQPAPELFFGQTPQRLPDPGRGLKGGLYQVVGQRPVAAGQHAGVAEQPTRVRLEARGQLGGVVWRDPVIITHHPPPRP